MEADTLVFMEQAIEQALLAQKENEVPVGAVVVLADRVIGRGYNSVIRLSDPTAHAEVQALRDAGRQLCNYRIVDADIFVTLEPCLMCYTALVHARIRRLYYGASDAKTGMFSTGAFDEVKAIFNHSIEVIPGIMPETAARMLQDFFRERRGARAVEWGGLENR